MSIQIGEVESVKRVIKAWNNGEELSLVKQMFSGSIAGIAAEGHRIRMQAKGKIEPRSVPHYPVFKASIPRNHRHLGNFLSSSNPVLWPGKNFLPDYVKNEKIED